MLVKQNLDVLREGMRLLNLYDAELMPDAVQAVRAAADVSDHKARQLHAVGALTSDRRGGGVPD